MKRTDDPTIQCQHTGQHGQCKYEVVPGTTKCSHHGGVFQDRKNQQVAANSYRLNIYKARLEQHSTHESIKDLRGEIGILRMLIETRLNGCKDDYDLMLQSSSIANLVVQVNTLVASCHRMETLTGQLLDRQSLGEFAAQVIEIIANNTSPEVSEQIAEEILCLIQT